MQIKLLLQMELEVYLVELLTVQIQMIIQIYLIKIILVKEL